MMKTDAMLADLPASGTSRGASLKTAKGLVLRVLAAMVVAIVGAASLGASPAFATSSYPTDYCHNLTGNIVTDGYQIEVCQFVDFTRGSSMNTLNHSAKVLIGKSATTATACKITSKVILNGNSNWTSPQVTRSCDNALDNRGTFLNVYFWGGQTSAFYGNAYYCIDLYYNNSTSSGWQRCYQTGSYVLQ